AQATADRARGRAPVSDDGSTSSARQRGAISPREPALEPTSRPTTEKERHRVRAARDAFRRQEARTAEAKRALVELRKQQLDAERAGRGEHQAMGTVLERARERRLLVGEEGLRAAVRAESTPLTAGERQRARQLLAQLERLEQDYVRFEQAVNDYDEPLVRTGLALVGFALVVATLAVAWLVG
ncbi:MAG: hypothetical protein AAGA56_29500, partial [Myxococcota bacterium]